MKQITLLMIVMLSITAFFAGCRKKEKTQVDISEPIVLNFVVTTGLPSMSLAEMITTTPVFKENIKVSFEVLETSDLLSAKIVSGDADIFIAPSNLGANLYNKGIDIRYVGCLVWGSSYIVTTENISKWEDLRGKEITMLGRGLTPDIVTRYLLKVNGLDPDKDVTINYVENITELSSMFIVGKSTISMMPEPALSVVKSKLSNVKVMLDLQEEWAVVSGAAKSYPQASLYVKTEVVKKHADFLNSFIKEYAASIERINADPEAAGQKAATFMKNPPADIIAKSIPGGNIRWVNSIDVRGPMEEYLNVLLESNPMSVGGSLPDDQFYYQIQ